MATAQSTNTFEPEKLRQQAQERPSALRSILAGSTAGAVEIGLLLSLPLPPSLLPELRIAPFEQLEMILKRELVREFLANTTVVDL